MRQRRSCANRARALTASTPWSNDSVVCEDVSGSCKVGGSFLKTFCLVNSQCATRQARAIRPCWPMTHYRARAVFHGRIDGCEIYVLQWETWKPAPRYRNPWKPETETTATQYSLRFKDINSFHRTADTICRSIDRHSPLSASSLTSTPA